MADHYANSWEELSTEIGASSDGDTIYITSDIDCNSEIPGGVESTISLGNITIDGSYEENGIIKSRQIRNLRTNISSPVPIFIFNYPTLRYIDFFNIDIDQALFLRRADTNNIYLDHCRFKGRRKYYLIEYQQFWRSSVTLTSCYFDMPSIGGYVPLVRPGASIYATGCYFVETYTGWDVAGGIDTSSYGINMSGCYTEGEIVGDNSIDITNNYSYDSPLQNVVDATLKTKSTEGTTINIAAPKGIWKNSIVNYEDESISYVYDNINTPLAIPESPSDMTNTTKLYNDGFDVAH